MFVFCFFSGVTATGTLQRNSQSRLSENVAAASGEAAGAVPRTNSLRLNGSVENQTNGSVGSTATGGQFTAFLEPLNSTSPTADSPATSPTSVTGSDGIIIYEY